MKLETSNTTAVTHGVESFTGFNIKASAQAFAILSSGLYKDPIKAIIRELSTNAVDAHVSAGTTNRPYDVELPTRYNPVFRIRDYGTGLSKEDVLSLYSTYFDSTKTDSNEQIGALGLGSKSPLGYSNNFSVVSYFNGRKYNFSVLIAEEGFPQIAVTGSSETDKHNGLEIIIPLKDASDVNNFVSKAKEVYTYFSIRPNILGVENFNIPELEYSVDLGNNIKANKNTGAGGVKIIMGSIAYPVSLDMVKDNINYHIGKVLNSYQIDIYANIGDVSFLPNREELSYDTKTVAYIIEKIDYIVDNLVKVSIASMKKAKTFYKFINILNGFSNELLKLLNAEDAFNELLENPPQKQYYLIDKSTRNWNGNVCYISFNQKQIQKLIGGDKENIIVYERSYRSYKPKLKRQGKIYSREISEPFNINTLPVIYINDTNYKVKNKFARAKNISHYSYVVFSADPRTVEEAKKLKETIVKKMGLDDDNVKFISELEFNKPPSSVAQKDKNKMYVSVFRPISYSQSANPTYTWKWQQGSVCVDNLANNNQKVWVEKNGHKPANSDVIVDNNKNFLLTYKKTNVWDIPGGQIYGVKSGDISKIKNKKNWIHVDKWVKKFIKNLLNSESFQNISYEQDQLKGFINFSKNISVQKRLSIVDKNISAIVNILGSVNVSSYEERVFLNNVSMLPNSVREKWGIDISDETMYNDGIVLLKFINEHYKHLLSIVDGIEKDEAVEIINKLYN